MAQQKISMSFEFDATCAKVFEDLGDHENFGKICGINAKRVKDGDDALNGLGSVRRMKIGPLPGFEETITEYEQDRLIVYKITKGSPIKNHMGRMEFSEKDGKSQLHYDIVLESKIPGTTGIIKAALERGITQGIEGYAKALKA